MTEPCLSPALLSQYLEDRLDAAEREAAEEHLSRCPACRRRLSESFEAAVPRNTVPAPDGLKQRVKRFPESPAASRRSWLPLAAAVLALLGLVLLGPGRWLDAPPPPPDPTTLRSSGSESPSPSGPALVSPAADARVETASLGPQWLVFQWQEAPEARRYTLILVDPLGNVLHREIAQESEVQLDLAVLQATGAQAQEVFWYVRTDLDDGTVVESKTRRLVLLGPNP